MVQSHHSRLFNSQNLTLQNSQLNPTLRIYTRLILTTMDFQWYHMYMKLCKHPSLRSKIFELDRIVLSVCVDELAAGWRQGWPQ